MRRPSIPAPWREPTGAVVGYYAAIARRASLDTWAFAQGQGLFVGAVVAVLGIVVESVSEKHVNAGSLVVAALAAVGAVVLVALLANGVMAPVRIAREQSEARAAEIDELEHDHALKFEALHYGHDVQVTELKGELAEARQAVAVLEEQASRPDRVALLREACKDGKNVLTRLVYLSNEHRRFEAACDWARDVWAMLREHFPQRSQEFYGPDSEALRGALFSISCQAEIDSMNGYVETYVEAKLALLHDLLNQYDVSS